MPIDTHKASKVWNRYAWARDNGHLAFVEKADKCDRFFRGDQWCEDDRAKLKQVKRPALTINKVLSTISNVMGEQIVNRSEVVYRPRSGAPAEVAEALTKVFKQISDNNKLDWLRSDLFADGIITSRGFLDVRLGYHDTVQGEVKITKLNPKNVVVDPDAEDYDPDTWSDVMVTKWLTADDIAVLYNAEDAEFLRNRDMAGYPYGHDVVQAYRDRFGTRLSSSFGGGADHDHSNVTRNLRVIERQYRELDKQKHFVSQDGDTRPIPKEFDRDRIALFVEQFGFRVINKLTRRIKWTVVCGDVVLYDDWSPYEHFTVVPFFPHFRHGHTIGLVENLLDPQEVLNKITSQELHVINTTANSGYMVRAGALVNMTVEELEQKGAQTGIVIEVNGDPDKDVRKIQPNQVPQGLDRASYKAEEHIKTISGVSDSMMGFDREDVAAKAIQAKRQAGSTNLVKPIDSLVRTDHIIARNVLDLVQQFYTEERLVTITKNSATGEVETFSINQATAEGQIKNDLTLGEYDVVVSSVPVRETLEDSQFEQAMALRQAGIQIPDSVLIEASRLQRKTEILRLLQGDQNSPEAQAQRELEQRAREAEVAKTEGEAQSRLADAQLKGARARKESTLAQREEMSGPVDAAAGLDAAKAQHEASLKEREFERDTQMKFAEIAMKREEKDMDQRMKAAEIELKREEQRLNAAQQAARAALRPVSNQGV